MKYVKIFQNTQAFSVSAGNNNSENQLVHIFLDNFQNGGKFTVQIVIHQV